MNKIIALADFHVRQNQRHQEYKEVFNRTIEEIKKIKNIKLILILGDVFHTKNIISGESFQLTYSFIKSLTNISEVLIIPGNHDAYVTTGKHSLKVFKEISKDINKISHYKLIVSEHSEIIDFNDFMIGHFSLFDDIKIWKQKLKTSKNKLNIALYHGIIKNAVTDANYKFKEGLSLSLFKKLGYDRGFFGDIHKFQFVDKEERFVYPGSLITQNFGESNNKGFISYDLEEDKIEFYQVLNDYVFYNLIYDDENKNYTNEIKKLDGSKIRLKIKYKIPLNYSEYNNLVSGFNQLKDKKIIYITKESCIEDDQPNIDSTTLIANLNVSRPEIQEDLMKEIYNSEYKNSKIEYSSLLELNKKYFDLVAESFKDRPREKLIWRLDDLKFKKMLVYEKERIDFDFEDLGIFAPNRIGKSALLNIIMFSIFGSAHSIGKQNLPDILSAFDLNSKAVSDIILENNQGNKYKIHRTVKLLKNESTQNELTVYKKEENGWEKIGDGLYKMNPWIKRHVGNADNAEIFNFSIDNNLDAVIRGTPYTRLDKLSEALHLNVLDWQKKYSRSDRKTLIDILEKFKDTNFQEALNQLNKNIDEYEFQVSNLKVEKKKIEGQLINIDRSLLKIDLAEYKNRLKANTNRVSKIDSELEMIKIKLTKIASLGFDIEDKLRIHIEKIRNIQNKINRINKSFGQIEFTINSTIKIAKLVENIKCNRNDCPLLNWALGMSSTYNQSIKRKQKLETILNESTGSIKKLSEKENKLRKVLSKQKDFMYEDKSLQQEKLYKDQEIERIIQKINQVERLQEFDLNSLQNLDEQLEKIDDKIETFAREIGSLRQKKEQVKTLYANYLRQDKELKLYDVYVGILDRIKSKVINTIVPRINLKANELLDLISIPFSVEMTAEGDIFLIDEKGKREIRTGSGSEKTFASLVFRLSMIQNTFLPVFDTFVLDEPVSMLDEEFSEKFKKMLQIIKESLGMKIILVTNLEAFKDVMDNRMTIEKDNKGFSHLVK